MHKRGLLISIVVAFGIIVAIGWFACTSLHGNSNTATRNKIAAITAQAKELGLERQNTYSFPIPMAAMAGKNAAPIYKKYHNAIYNIGKDISLHPRLYHLASREASYIGQINLNYLSDRDILLIVGKLKSVLSKIIFATKLPYWLTAHNFKYGPIVAPEEFNYAKFCAKAINFDARAAEIKGDLTRTTNDIEAIVRIREQMTQEKSLIGCSVQMALENLAETTVFDGLKRNPQSIEWAHLVLKTNNELVEYPFATVMPQLWNESNFFENEVLNGNLQKWLADDGGPGYQEVENEDKINSVSGVLAPAYLQLVLNLILETRYQYSNISSWYLDQEKVRHKILENKYLLAFSHFISSNPVLELEQSRVRQSLYDAMAQAVIEHNHGSWPLHLVFPSSFFIPPKAPLADFGVHKPMMTASQTDPFTGKSLVFHQLSDGFEISGTILSVQDLPFDDLYFGIVQGITKIDLTIRESNGKITTSNF